MSMSYNIKPIELRDFIKSRGWTQVEAALNDGEYLFNHKDISRQIYFPTNKDVCGFDEVFDGVLRFLAKVEDIEPWLLARRIETSRDDGVSFRVTNSVYKENSIPLSFASSMISGAEDLLLSAAHSVIMPQVYHPRMNRSEAKKMIEFSRFRHTEPGSFILNISCPLHALDDIVIDQLEIEGLENNDPFVRKAMILMHSSIARLIDAIEKDSIYNLIDNEKQNKRPSLSYNLCEAISSFYCQGIGNDLEYKSHWSILRPNNDKSLNESCLIQSEYFPIIEEVARELKPKDEEIEGIFYGTVEELSGVIGENGKRAGDVLLHILTSKGNPIKVRANLNVDAYEKADEAHMAAHDAYIKIKGRLLPGKQPQRMIDISYFDLANN